MSCNREAQNRLAKGAVHLWLMLPGSAEDVHRGRGSGEAGGCGVIPSPACCARKHKLHSPHQGSSSFVCEGPDDS